METLTDVLRRRSRDQASAVAYVFLPDDGDGKIELTYGDLDRRARAIAERLSDRMQPGDRVLLVYPPGPEFALAFLGCTYAGIVPVPVYPPHARQGLGPLLRIAVDAQVQAALTTDALEKRLGERLADTPIPPLFEIIATDSPTRASTPGAAFSPHPLAPSDTAFLQYTSGSTGRPKGVVVTHANLAHNEQAISKAFGLSNQTVGCGWLPTFHDMGLVGNLLNPLFCGFPVVLFSPLAFMKRPGRWLEVISNHGVTATGGPNFAYDACVKHVKPEARDQLDLSRWEVAFCGAEPVRAETAQRFAEYFAPAGFRARSFSPCYGLAESTLLVTAAPRAHWVEQPLVVDRAALGTGEVRAADAGAPPASTQALLSCGVAGHDTRVVVVDARQRVLKDDAVGEIWVAGGGVAQGYWGDEAATREVFDAHTAGGDGPFLRTGDLGFLHRDELFVTGRMKDVLIVRGRNYYPHDIEDAVEACHPALHPSRSVAFSIDGPDGTEVAIVAEVQRRALRGLDVGEVTSVIRRAVVDGVGLAPGLVGLVGPGGVLRTSSGKVRRSACREALARGELQTLNVWRPAPAPEADDAEAQGARHAELVNWILQWLSEELQLPHSEVDAARPLTHYGLDSRAGVELILAMESRLARRISPELLWDATSISAFASALLDPTAPVDAGKAFAKRGNGAQPASSKNASRPPNPPRCGTIDFSLFFFATDQGADEDKYRLVMESARLADQRGLAGIWTPERHFHPFGGLFPNPAIIGAALARETTRLRIRAGSVVLPLSNPIRVAEEWAVVDNLSGGRVDIGFTSGWNPNDFVLNPEAYGERTAITRKGMDTVKRLWRGEAISSKNASGEDVQVRIYPRPLQPEAAVWLTCTRTSESFIHAGTAGANVLTALLLQTTDELAERIAEYRKARADAGHDPKTGRVSLMLHTFLGEDTQAVKELVRPSLTDYLRTSVGLWRQGSERLSELSEEERERLPDLAFERYFRTSSLLGTVDDARRTVEKVQALGVNEIACLVDFGLPTETVLKGLEKVAALSERMSEPQPSSASEKSAATKPAANFAGAWVRTALHRPRADVKLFCFPFAGGSVGAFDGWERQLPACIEVSTVDAPQRYEQFDELLEALAPSVLELLDRPFAFYGHSLGSLIAFELARHLERHYGKSPMHLFVAAQQAPHAPFPYPSVQQLQTPAGAPLLDLAFPPPEGLAGPQLDEHRRCTLDRIRPGMLIQSTNYAYQPGEPLACPITAFGGLRDRVINRRLLEQWREHTASAFRVETFPGGHLFLRKSREELLGRIGEALSRVAAPHRNLEAEPE